MNKNKRSLASSSGFTAIEYITIFALIALISSIALVNMRGTTAGATVTASYANAEQLVKAVDTYVAMTGDATLNGLDTTYAKPMTRTRANTIYAKISGALTINGVLTTKEVVASNYALPANAAFPAGWGEIAVGRFDPLP